MKRISILFLSLALSLSACGGPSTSIHVVMTDFAFTPNSFTVPAGQPISVEFTNNGAATHSFIIMKQGAQVQSHFTDADKANVYWEEPAVAAGQSAKATFNAPTQPGEYQVVCGVPAHFESGMVATLVVVKSP
jgi:plastocyanin